MENVDLPPCRLPDEIMQEDDSNSVAFTAKKEDIEADTSGKMVSLSLSSFSGRWAKCLFIRILYCFLREKGKQKHVK